METGDIETLAPREKTNPRVHRSIRRSWNHTNRTQNGYETRRVDTRKHAPQMSRMLTLLMSKSPPLRLSDQRHVAGSATVRDTSKKTAKSSKRSKTVRRVHFHRKLESERSQIKETKRRKRSPNPPVPPKHAPNAQRRKHLTNRHKSA